MTSPYHNAFEMTGFEPLQSVWLKAFFKKRLVIITQEKSAIHFISLKTR